MKVVCFERGALYVRKPQPIRRIFKVPYVNMGLLYGLKRSGGHASLEDSGNYPTFGAIARELVNSAPACLREKVLAAFIHRNTTQLKKFPIPWFIPEHLGGLGLPICGRFRPCLFDLQIARKIWNSSDYSIPTRPSVSDWQVWKLALSRLPNSFHSAASWLSAENSQSYGGRGLNTDCSLVGMDTIAGLLCVEAFFRAGDISVLLKDTSSAQSKTISRYFRCLANVLVRARNDSTTPLPEPFNIMRFPPLLPDRGDVPVAKRIRIE